LSRRLKKAGDTDNDMERILIRIRKELCVEC